MKTITQTLFLFASILVLVSCGNYNHVTYQRNSNSKNSSAKKESTRRAEMISATETKAPSLNEMAYAGLEDDLDFTTLEVISSGNSISIEEDTTQITCDQLVLKNGEDKEVKVQMITESTIRYKNCDHLDGPDYEKSLGEVLFVKYANGKKEVFADTKPKQPETEKVVVPKRVSNSSGENNSLTGFILGLTSIFLFWTGIVPILGLCFAWTGIIKGRHESDISRFEGMAIIGVVLSSLGIIAAAIVVGFGLL